MPRIYFQFEEGQDYSSKTLEIILLTLMGAVLFVSGGFIEMPEYSRRWEYTIFAVYAMCVPLLFLNRRAYTRLASLLLIIGLWAIATVLALTGGGISTIAAFIYVIIVYIAGIQLGEKAGVVMSVICTLTLLALAVIEITGYMPSRPLRYTPITRLMGFTLLIVIMTGLQYLAARVIEDALRQTKRELEARERMAEVLRESETLFRTMFENSGSGMALVDLRGRPVRCNPALQTILGYTEEELSRKPFTNFTHAADRELDRRLFLELISGKRHKYEIDKRFVTKDGRVIWGSLIASLVRDEKSLPKYGLGMVQDITERKRVEGEKRKLLHHLGERVKELTVLHRAARILQRQIISVAGVLDELSKLLPLAFQYPDSATVRFRLGQDEAVAPDFTDSAEVLRADFTTADGLQGSIEVVYHKDFPPENGGSFLEEERALVNTLADMLKTSYDRQKAEQQLKITTKQLRALMVRLGQAREEEGTRIAREIHDELGSALTTLRWNLEDIHNTSGGADPRRSPSELQEKTADMISRIDAIIDAVRKIASELRPPILDDLGLPEALEWQAEEFQERAGIACRCNFDSGNIDLNREKSTAIFRIFQEALTNILRHAQATRIDITSAKSDPDFILTIRDNGKGIAESEQFGLKSLGILGMRERAFLVGGGVEIKGIAGKGTVIRVRIPILD